MQIFLSETAAGLLLGTIGIGGYVFGVHDGVMFFSLLGLSVIYYYIFASGRVFPRDTSGEADEDALERA
jgi:hypothetical protein